MAVLTRRGYTGAGGGRASLVTAPPEWRATSVQVCGLWPWAVGGGSPTIGVPLGKGLRTGKTVCFDPLSWFTDARLILNPSVFVLGLPALGKSTTMRREVIGVAGMGVTPLVLGDLKPDYTDVVTALGGQVIRLGRGQGAINVLDVGAMDQAADRLGDENGARLHEEAHGRRLNVVKALLTVVRHSPTRDYEDTVLSAALRELATRWQRRDSAPLLQDLVALIEEGPAAVRAVTLDRGSDERYRDVIDPLLRSLLALIDGPIGGMVARATTERLRLDAPAIALDVSSISSNDTTLAAAALLVCWSEGFGAVEAANALADAGLEPQRNWFIVMDELWRVLRAGEGLVNRVDELTRLNRNEGVAQAMITHSLADMRALDSASDREKAGGFVERAGAVLCAGLPDHELADLERIIPFSRAERSMVTSWSTPPGWGAAAEPPGRGNMMLKVGVRPGIPFHVDLTPAELGGMNDTNRRWKATG
jgi:hypothetical protein